MRNASFNNSNNVTAKWDNYINIHDKCPNGFRCPVKCYGIKKEN